MISPARRKALVLAASMGAAAALAALGKPVPHDDASAPALSLDTLFPREFGDWRVDAATEAFVRPAARQGKVYKIYDQVLERSFVNSQGQRIMVSAAFGREQSAGMQMHRPEVCYPGGGLPVFGAFCLVVHPFSCRHPGHRKPSVGYPVSSKNVPKAQ